jgi:hypothetical protein
MKPEEIAFNDITKAVNIDEFNAVLDLCKKQHSRIKRLIEKRTEFREESKARFSGLYGENSQVSDEARSGMKRLSEVFLKNADRELVKHIEDELGDFKSVTEFLIRFSEVGEYEHLNIDFVEEIKKEINSEKK